MRLSSLLVIGMIGLAWPAQDPTTVGLVSAINVQGLTRLSSSQVLALGGLAAGRTWTAKELDEGVKRLVESGLIIDARYDLASSGRDTTLTLIVREPAWTEPVIFDNFIWFEDDVIVKAVAARIPSFDGRIPDTAGAQASVTAALEELLRDAHLAFHVEHASWMQVRDGARHLRFFVTGAPLSICDVRFASASASVAAELTKAVTFMIGRPYSRTDLMDVIEKGLLPIYLKRGELDATFGAAMVEPGATPACASGVRVTLPIDEGVPYRMGAVTVVGASAETADGLKKAWPLKTGAVFDATAAAGFRLKAVHNRLVPVSAHVIVAASPNRATHIVDVVITIS